MQKNNWTIKSLLEAYKNGSAKPADVFADYIAKIKTEDKQLNSYLSVLEEYPVEDFDASKVLSGIPCALKDNMLLEGTVATSASKILKNYVSAYDATAVKKLKDAGALFTGKTNLDEFAMGGSTENSAFGVVKNPHDHTRVAGGSSGGSAAAVAADLAVFSLGSDTGGSIREPASFCGVVGFKPSYGRVSRHGLMAMASSLDQIGPITKNVYDAALVLNHLVGKDKFDSTTVEKPEIDFTKNLDKDIKGLRVGVPKEYFGEGLDPEVKEKVELAISRLKNMGCEIKEVSLPHSKYALATYYIVMPCEVSSNLSRFDGIRYGHSSKEGENLLEVYSKSRAEGFGAEVKRRIILGTYALSSGYYDAYYLKAQKVRSLLKQDFDKAFQEVDVIVGPTAPSTAPKIGDKSEDPLAMYLMDMYTVTINLIGAPAISIPCGIGANTNMPVGFQIIGKMFDEETILRVGHQLESALQ
jgi:aspartyl-tRNA(Asn)/glutamyl-tRNA(Gln) amidotransferase subunit A